MAGCADRHASGAPPASSTAIAGSAAAAEGTADDDAGSAAPPATAPTEWIVAVRMERWDDAARLTDALSESERSSPKMRFLRARIAIERARWTEAKDLLKDLDKQLPMLRDEIASYRTQCQVEVGPFDEAAKQLLASNRISDLVIAGEAQMRGGKLDAALETLGRAITRAERRKYTELLAEARGLRVDIREQQGKLDLAVPDLHWLAEHVPARPEGRKAWRIIREKKTPLSPKRMLAAMENLIGDGQTQEALEIALGLEGLSKAETLHAQAWATYRTRDYPKAVEAWKKAASVQSGRTAEQLYYWARSLARAGQVDQAIKKHEEVVRRFRKDIWAERASYQKARLLLSEGEYARAAEAYTSYLGKFPKGASRHDAEYDLALAQLSAGQPAKAQKTFHALAANARKREVGRLMELEGLAAMRAGDKETAVNLWKEVARELPLTWGAMMARARLKEAGIAPPPLMAPAPKALSAPLSIHLPKKVQLLSSLGLDADAEAALIAEEHAVADNYDDREGEALCAMYGRLSRAERRFKVGVRAVRFDWLMRTPAESERWAWDCLYPRPYSSVVGALEEKQELPSGLVYALMRQESGFRPGVTSPVGAAGLMQLMPTTATAAAEEASITYNPALIKSPDVNIALGAFYIGKLHKTFKGNTMLAVASYNAGPTAVSQWLAGAGKDAQADLFAARIPYEETRTYVARVMGNLVRYQWLAGGEEAVSDFSLELPLDARASDDAY